MHSWIKIYILKWNEFVFISSANYLKWIKQFPFDRTKNSNFCFFMQPLQYQKLLSKTQIFLGVLLSVCVFIFMSIILKPLTFSPDPLIAQLQACFAAVPIATTFWFACNMFMLVLSDQIKQKKDQSKSSD